MTAPFRFLSLSCVLLLLCSILPSALASPITYTLTGNVDASSNGLTETNTYYRFTWVVTADTSGITSPAPGQYQNPAVSSVLTIQSSGSHVFALSGGSVFLDTSKGQVTFGSTTAGGIGLIDPQLTSWDLSTSIGPLSDPNVLVAGTVTSTGGQVIKLTGVLPVQNPVLPCQFQASNPPPAIANVQNAASNIPQGLPNAPIAQGSLFVVKGTALGPGNIAIATNAFQTTNLSGTSVTITVGNVTANAPLYYASWSQVAALLPSNTPAGAGTITVTYNGQTSAAAPVNVVAHNLGILTLDSSGAGPAIVTFPDYSLVSAVKTAGCGGAFTACGSANPGDTLTLWGTGLGPVSGNDVSGSGLGQNMPNIPLTLWLGGVQAPVTYQGRSGCCVAEDQIVFKVPANVPTGCAVPLVAQIGNAISNTALVPVAVGNRNCTPVNPGLAAANLEQAVLAGPVTYGTINLFHFMTGGGTLRDNAHGTPVFYTSVASPGTEPFFVSWLDDPPLGTCAVLSNLLGVLNPPAGVPATAHVNAGASSTLQGPNGSVTLMNNPFVVTPINLQGTYLVPGAYTVTGTGGSNIGSFSANFTIPTPPALTNPANSATVTRSSGMTVSWAGGVGNVGMEVFGPTDQTNTTGASAWCTAPAGAGTFTIPPYVLLALPANDPATFNAGFIFSSIIPEVPFTATGLNAAWIFSYSHVAGFGTYEESPSFTTTGAFTLQ